MLVRTHKYMHIHARAHTISLVKTTGIIYIPSERLEFFTVSCECTVYLRIFLLFYYNIIVLEIELLLKNMMNYVEMVLYILWSTYDYMVQNTIVWRETMEGANFVGMARKASLVE